MLWPARSTRLELRFGVTLSMGGKDNNDRNEKIRQAVKMVKIAFTIHYLYCSTYAVNSNLFEERERAVGSMSN
jgi:hypothetical protein